MHIVRRTASLHVAALALVVLVAADQAHAMCGAMLVKQPDKPVRKPDDPGAVASTARLTNHATKVVMVREGDATVVTMSNDFDGDVVEFGLVVPVPSVVTKEDVKLLEARIFDELEAATAPVLVEHYDPDPCPEPPSSRGVEGLRAAAPAMAESAPKESAKKLKASDYGVKVESHFAAGEYDIAVLSGKDSGRLIDWLKLFKYDVPAKAESVIRTYLAQKTYFLVAHVDLRKMQREGRAFLRPLQMKTKSPKFMLPIRLGMVNADGPQELVVYALSPEGRVEPTNYRSARMPTDQQLPPFVKQRFTEIERTAFKAETQRQDMRVVFTEWNGAASSVLERRALIDSGIPAGAATRSWNLSRLHFLYDEAHFPEDLVLQATQDRAQFAVRHHVTHPWSGSADACDEARTYFAKLPARQEREAQALANLTGWSLDRARSEAGLPAAMSTTTTDEPPPPPPPKPKVPWYKKLWGD